MYPRNAASPEPIAIGAVVQISDGAIQTSGVTVRIKPVGVAEGNGAGTTAYSTDGVVLYTPTQAETNYTSFVLIASKTGCIPASQTVITSESTTSGRVYVATNGDKAGYSLSTAGVTAVTAGVWNALLSSYTVNGSFGARLIRSTNSNNEVSLTGGPTPHIAADVHALQAGVITAGAFAAGAIDANALAEDAVTEIQAGLALQSTLLSAKSVTDKLNTGLIADGAVFQFTANMLELAPAASGGGSATIENQELILNELDTLRNSFASAVGRLAVASQITGFPAAIVRNSDYSTVTDSEIRLSLNDLDGNPITEIGGVQCSEIDWLFGIGSERAPAIIEGAATWDNANNQLVIQIAADDTAATALGTLSWQIGCSIDTTTRFLGGGTTRLIERHF